MDLKWRAGASHQVPDALSRLHRFYTPGKDFEDSFPDDASLRSSYSGPEGPALDGVPLNDLGADSLPLEGPGDVAVVATAHLIPHMLSPLAPSLAADETLPDWFTAPKAGPF